jgi:hypothetical protein
MILKDKCKELGITLSEGKAKYGLTHWKQHVPESCDEIAEVAEDVMDVALEVLEEIKPAEVAVVKAVLEVAKDVIVDLTSAEDRRKSVKGLGERSPYWTELRGE